MPASPLIQLKDAPQRILGIDPGLRATGYGVIEARGREGVLIDCGVIETNSSQPLPERLGVIYDGVEDVILRLSPDRMVLEKLIYCKNVSTALLLGQARGAALAAGARHGLPMSEFSPAEIKSAVTGRGSAAKEQVQKMIQLLLSLSEPPESNHAADALAAALTYIHSKAVHDILSGKRRAGS